MSPGWLVLCDNIDDGVVNWLLNCPSVKQTYYHEMAGGGKLWAILFFDRFLYEDEAMALAGASVAFPLETPELGDIAIEHFEKYSEPLVMVDRMADQMEGKTVIKIYEDIREE